MLDAVLAYVAMLLIFLVSHPLSWVLGLFAPLSLIAYDLTPDEKEPGFFACVLYRLSFIGFIVPVAIIGNYAISAKLLPFPYLAGRSVFGAWLAVAVVSSIAAFFMLRFGLPAINKLKSKLTKRSELRSSTVLS